MALLKYTVLRLAVFVAVAAGLYVVGVRNLWFNALLSILISGAISLVLLDRVRNEAGMSVSRISQRLESATTAEDDADDAARAGGVASVDDAEPESDEPNQTQDVRAPERTNQPSQDRNSDQP